MRFSLCALAALLLAGCLQTEPFQRIAVPVAVPPKPILPPRIARREISGIMFEGVAFDSRSHRLVVADQPGGPGSLYADSAAAAKALGGIAAVNAGFFTPEGAPLGLVAAAGKISGAWNGTSSLGSGVWHQTRAGRSAITRREALGRGKAKSSRELIQAGPLLVENSRVVGGLDAAKASARTVILWDGGSRWWVGCTSPCTLAALAQALDAGEPADWTVRQALNLDGGRSSDLWISRDLPGGPILRRPPWNRPVRNFLVLSTR